MSSLKAVYKQSLRAQDSEVDLLKEISYEEINEVMKGLKNSDASGPNNLTTRTIKKLRPSGHTIIGADAA